MDYYDYDSYEREEDACFRHARKSSLDNSDYEYECYRDEREYDYYGF